MSSSAKTKMNSRITKESPHINKKIHVDRKTKNSSMNEYMINQLQNTCNIPNHSNTNSQSIKNKVAVKNSNKQIKEKLQEEIKELKENTSHTNISNSNHKVGSKSTQFSSSKKVNDKFVNKKNPIPEIPKKVINTEKDKYFNEPIRNSSSKINNFNTNANVLTTDSFEKTLNFKNIKTEVVEKENPQKYKMMEEILNLKMGNTKKQNEIIVTFLFKLKIILSS